MKISKKKKKQIDEAINTVIYDMMKNDIFFDQTDEQSGLIGDLDRLPDMMNDETKIKFDMLSEIQYNLSKEILKLFDYD